MAQHFGLMSIAQTEFEQLVEDNPGSGEAQRLLDNLVYLRE
jgi:hypothetical protein